MPYAARLAGAGVICLYALTIPIQAATPIGKVFAKSGSPSASGPDDIKTANATIGIRGTAFDFSSGRATLVAVHAGRVNICAYGKCESVDDRCGVGRAGNNDVDELGGKAKGRAIRSLPYILNQGALARPFRVSTSSCRSVATLFQNFFGEGSQGGSNRPGGGARGEGPPDTGGYGD